MLFRLPLFILSSAVTVLTGLAPEVATNPADVVLRADFPSGGSQTVVGVIQFYSLNGTTKVHVDVTGLPKNSGIFSYHIHEKPVGINGLCSDTAGHLNPFNAPEDCDAQASDAFCEVGDLSGKHGLINTTCFETFYYDPYLSLDPTSPQFIGGKSINIHLVEKNNERLACATIKPSREPEDLLLLNSETEAQEVQKYEEIAGIRATPSAPLEEEAQKNGESDSGASLNDYESVEDDDADDDDNTLYRREENSDDYEEEIVEEIVEDEDAAEFDDDSTDKSEESWEDSSSRKDQKDDQATDLDDLIYEDIEKYRNTSLSNITSSYNASNATNISGIAGEDGEENQAPLGFQNLKASIIFGAIMGLLVSWCY